MKRLALWHAVLACVAFVASAYAQTPRPPGIYALDVSQYWQLTAPSSLVTLAVQVVPSSAGIPVTLSVPASGPSLALPNGSTAITVMTDANGIAEVDAVANTVPGLANVYVSAPGAPYPARLSHVITGAVTLSIDETVRHRFGEGLLDARVQMPWYPCSETLEPYFFQGNASLTLNGMPIAAGVSAPECDYSNGKRVEGSTHVTVQASAGVLPGTYDFDLLFAAPHGIPLTEAKGTLVLDPDASVQTAQGTVAFSLGYTTVGYHAGRCAAVSASAGQPGDDGFPASAPPGVDLVSAVVKVNGTQCDWQNFDYFDAPYPASERIVRQDALLASGDEPFPPGTQVWAYGPSSDNPAPHWYALPTAISGSSAMFAMMDGGAGDNSIGQDNELHGTLALGVPRAAAIAGSFQDLWWAGPQENGWGMSLTQHGDRLFAGLFIYDANGDPTWLVMSSGSWNAARTEYSGNLYRPHGSPFSAYDATRFSAGPPVGTLKLTVTSLDALTLDYTIDGLSGRKSMQRQLFGPSDPFYFRPMSDLWWGGPGQNGWGIAIAQQYSTGFGVLFTYDGSGNPTWFALPAVRPYPSSQTLHSPIYRTRGSPWVGVPYDASRFSAAQAGGANMEFAVGSGYVAFSIDGTYVYQPLAAQPF